MNGNRQVCCVFACIIAFIVRSLNALWIVIACRIPYFYLKTINSQLIYQLAMIFSVCVYGLCITLLLIGRIMWNSYRIISCQWSTSYPFADIYFVFFHFIVLWIRRYTSDGKVVCIFDFINSVETANLYHWTHKRRKCWRRFTAENFFEIEYIMYNGICFEWQSILIDDDELFN